MVLPTDLLELDGPVKQAVGIDLAETDSTTMPPLVVFATAGSKGVVRVWSTRRPHPLHTLEPLAAPRSMKGEGEGAESAEVEVSATYMGLHYNESLDVLAAVTYDQNIVFFSGHQFHTVKQVRFRMWELPLHKIACKIDLCMHVIKSTHTHNSLLAVDVIILMVIVVYRVP